MHVGHVLGHVGEPVVAVHLPADALVQADAPLRVGERGPVLQVAVALVEAGIGRHAADLVIEDAVRAEARDPVRALGHQLMPLAATGADRGKRLLGEEVQVVALAELVVELEVGRAPAGLALEQVSLFLVILRAHVHQVPLIVERHMAALLVHLFDAGAQAVRAAHRGADLKIRIAVVVAGVIPAEQAQRVKAVRLRVIVELRDRLVGPDLVAVLLLVDDQEVAVHPADPFLLADGLAPRRRPCGVLTRAAHPVALIEPRHVRRAGPRLARARERQLVHLQRDAAALIAAGAQRAGVEERIPAGEVQAGIALVEQHPLHGQRAGIGSRHLVQRLAAIQPGEVAADIDDALAHVARIEQVRAAAVQRVNRAEAGIDPVVERRVAAIVDGRFKHDVLAVKAQRERHADGQLAVRRAQAVGADGDGVALLRDRQRLLVREGDRLPVIPAVQHRAEQAGRAGDHVFSARQRQRVNLAPSVHGKGDPFVV